jgi:iron complex outermembrane receptor protein
MAQHPTHPLRRRHALAAAALTALAGSAWAQAAPEKNDAEQAPQVVEVTAQGRKQEVLQVPIAIQLIGPEQIAKLGAVNLAEVSSYVPGLQIDASEPTQPIFILRGLGNSDFGIGTDAPVGIYVNGLYTGKTAGALMNFNDIKRIEVIKGPQGTLFGRNSAGGAISIITNDPVDAFAASGLVRLGNHGAVHTEAMVNQPLGDGLALRFSGVTQQRDGWAKNVTTGDRMPHESTWGTRLSLGWTPASTTSVVFSWEHEDLDQRPRPAWAVVASTPVFNPASFEFVDPRKQPLRNDVANGRETRLFDGLSLRIEHDLGWASFSSLTGWRRFTTENLQDNDGTDNIASRLSTGNFGKNTTWQQEFRLSNSTPLVDWLVGLSLAQEDARQTSQVNTNTDSLDGLLALQFGIPPFLTLSQLALAVGLPDVNLLGHAWQENMHNTGDFKAQAVFADAIWHLTPRTNLTTGVRLTRDEKKFSWHNPLRSAPTLDPQLALFTPEFFQQLVDAGALDPGSAALLTALAQGLQSSNLEFANPDWYAAPVHARKSWTDVSPRLVLDHRLSADTMVFGSVTRGYQAGGFNAVSATAEANNGHFDPETVVSYEVGVKGRVPGMGLSYGASLFHYVFKNLQSITLDHSLAIPAYVVTVSDVQATGAELEAQWQLSPGLRLYGAAQYIDQTYQAQHNLAGGAPDLTGQPYGTPHTSLALGLDVRSPFAGGELAWSLQGSYIGPTRCNDDSLNQATCLSTPAFKVGEARERVDTRLGWEAPSRRWGMALVVNNLLDKQYINFASNLSAPVGSPFYVGLTDPRRVQIEFSARL